MVAALTELAVNPHFWMIMGITLVYCGVIALFAWLGTITATRLDSVSPESRAGRLTRHWGFWFAPAMAIFAAIMVLTMANHVITAIALVIPYAFFAAVGIYREGR
jgi:hypothetical protein